MQEATCDVTNLLFTWRDVYWVLANQRIGWDFQMLSSEWPGRGQWTYHLSMNPIKPTWSAPSGRTICAAIRVRVLAMLDRYFGTVW